MITEVYDKGYDMGFWCVEGEFWAWLLGKVEISLEWRWCGLERIRGDGFLSWWVDEPATGGGGIFRQFAGFNYPPSECSEN